MAGCSAPLLATISLPSRSSPLPCESPPLPPAPSPISPAPGVQFASSVVRHPATRLLYQQGPRRHVPGVHTPLVVAVQPPRGHVAQVQRRRPQPPHALGYHGEAPEELHGSRHLLTVVGEAGDHKRSYHLVRARHSYWFAVECGTLSALGDVGFFPHGVVDHPQDHLPRPLERYVDAEDGQPVGVVGRTIQGVDDPASILMTRQPASLLS